MEKHLVNASRYLTYILRHKPESINLVLDKEGWAVIDELLTKSDYKEGPLTRELLEEVVRNEDKKRLALSDDGQRIRALQGHSTTKVDIAFKAKVPPVLLFHGTATRFLDQIRKEGLSPQTRQYVHLSTNIETATAVGERHGKLAMLEVDCKRMLADGYEFYLSENNVWLTKDVPPKYLKFPA